MNGTQDIVVGYDASPEAQYALDWASQTARRRGMGVRLLHCVPASVAPMYPAMQPLPGPDALDAAAQPVLDEGVRRAEAALDTAHISTLATVGSPSAMLVEQSKDARMVVVGTRGRGRLLGGLLGSTAYTVTAHAHCPVVVVRVPPGGEEAEGGRTEPAGAGGAVLPGPARRVVVGVDDSEPAEFAVEEGARIAESAGASLHVVTVATVASMESWAYVETSSAGDEHTHEVRREAERILESAAERARRAAPEVVIETEVLYGEPGHALADMGSTAGLLVVGSRGRGGFAGLLLGSVSHAVIHEAECPVMVVR